MSVLLMDCRGGSYRDPVYDDVTSVENLFAAWRRFLNGKRGRHDVQQYARHIEDRLFDLHVRLKAGDWHHGAYQTFIVCDPKPRIIHKASVEDRIVHHALVRVIEPIFDRTFIHDSWSCRRGKGTHAAIARLRSQLRRISQATRKPVWVLKIDVRKYFASTNQDILIGLIQKKIHDTALQALIERVITSYPSGLPLGNLTSQLFANVYLDPFDHFVKEHLQPFVYLRYCDDMVLVHSDVKWLRLWLTRTEQYLLETLKLQLHPQKISLRPWHHGIDWLGAMMYPDRVMTRMSTKRRMRCKIDMVTRAYLNGGCSAEMVQSVFTSYDGLLKPMDEGYARDYQRCLLDCL